MIEEQEVQNIEISIEQANKCIETKVALERLIKNSDFNTLITKGYFENEASRLVLMKADPSMEEDKYQKNIIKSIDGIGAFRQYLRAIIQIGTMAERDKLNAQEELELSENEVH